jgi:predicted acyl esterase
VRIEIRDRHGVQHERAEQEWPLARTDYRELYLDMAGGCLTEQVPEPSSLRQDAAQGSAHFDITFDQPCEITGHAALRLWVEAEGSDDADLFIALQKLDAQGQEVGFTFYAFYENGPIALGWQRASHRELDTGSTPERPIHRHLREQRLEPGQCVPVEIELWPFSVRFDAGETLRLAVSGCDIYRPEPGAMLPFPQHQDTRNAGHHIFHGGGAMPSRLILPFIPASEHP